MRNKQHRPRSGRRHQIETLELRQVMSADPLGGALVHHAIDDPPSGDVALDHHTLPEADFWLDPRDLDDIDQTLGDIEQMLSSAHNSTGWNQVQTNYGFRGAGQTVAVIDSGVAYDHWALGGGFGANFRVVGGKDFAENDNNPFDDGTEGSHGTHVAGIIGSSHGTNTGVAPEVDLVALRVFDDAGNGYFSWVEQALQWIYTNRNAFENPITAINLSIGSSWNAAEPPSWSTLEDEFAQLKSVGIFTAVSAGNSYSSYGVPGLSYPAASPHVVPVMSVADSGAMANYSQRHTLAIAAPGNGIISTVPDYAGNHNGVTDDFASKSGTSMAAPYVAGASVLIRQAMQFVGMTNITQTTIYNHMRATADAIGTTGYLRLNLGNAIDALIPNDEYGSTVATAYNMGTVSGDTQRTGMLNTLTDDDYFRFTAGVTGTVSFTAALSHGQTADWLASGLTGGTSGSNGETYTLQIVAGQSYTIGISTNGGIAHYELEIDVQSGSSSNSPPVLAAIGNKTVNEGSLLTFTATATDSDLPANSLNYSLTGAPAGATINATTGIFTWTPTESQGPGTFSVTVRVTDNGSPALTDSETITITVNQVNAAPVLAAIGNKTVNEGSLLTFTATATDSDLPANSLNYSLTGVTAGATISATTGIFTWTPTESQGPGTFSVTVRVTDNGSPALTDSEAITITVNQPFTDWGTITQEQTNNASNNGTRWYRVQSSQSGYLTAEAFFSGGDIAVDWFDADMQQVATGGAVTGGKRVDAMATGATYYLRVTGTNSDIDFRLTNLVSVAGATATVNGTSVSDSFTFVAGTTQHAVTVNSVSYTFSAATVDTINFNGGSAADSITLTGTAGNETATIQLKTAQFTSSDYAVGVGSVANITIFGGGGNDAATLYGTSGDDLYSVWSDRARMSGSGYNNEARYFNTTVAHAQAGFDRAYVYDSAADDTYTASWDRVELARSGALHEARGFDRTVATATTGNDTAILNGTTGNDVFSAWWDHAVMYGNGYQNDTAGFKSTVGISSTGVDQAFLYDSAGDDRYRAWSDRASMTGGGFANEAQGFDEAYAFATIGNDRADLYDSAGDDTYTAWWNRVRLSGSGYYNEANGFDRTKAHATAGTDSATFHDSTGNDVFAVWPDHAVMYGDTYFNDSMGFDSTIGYATTGYDKASFYDSDGDDTYTAWWNRIVMIGDGFRNEARSFDRTMGRGATGNDSATLHDTTGNDRFTGWSTHSVLYGDGYFNDTWMFKSVLAIASTGDDRVSLYDSEGDDTYTAWWNRVVLDSDHSTNDARNFDRTMARGTDGNDRVTFYDSPGNDVYSAWSNHAIMYGPGFSNDTSGFNSATGHSSAGVDQAFLYDSSGSDIYEAWTNRAALQGLGYRNEAHNFRRAYGHASGGHDHAILYDGSANDSVHSLAWGAYMTDSAKYHNEVRGFDAVEARRTTGGIDRAFISVVDYVFELIGGWSA